MGDREATDRTRTNAEQHNGCNQGGEVRVKNGAEGRFEARLD